MTKHIAASGARAGQWVTCPAKIQCTLNTTHASDQSIEKTRLWKQNETNNGKKVSMKDITEQDYIQYLQISEEDKNIYNEMFQDREKEKNKRIKERHDEGVAKMFATNSTRNLEEQNPPKRLRRNQKRDLQRYEKADNGNTITMENGLIVEKANYTPEQKQKAEEAVDKISTILGKWDVAALSQKELKDFSNYAKNATIFGTHLFAEKTHKVVMEGLKTKSQNLTAEDAKKFRNASIILEQLQFANLDIVRGYKVGSYQNYINSVQDPKNWIQPQPKKKKTFLSRFLP